MLLLATDGAPPTPAGGVTGEGVGSVSAETRGFRRFSLQKAAGHRITALSRTVRIRLYCVIMA